MKVDGKIYTQQFFIHFCAMKSSKLAEKGKYVQQEMKKESYANVVCCSFSILLGEI